MADAESPPVSALRQLQVACEGNANASLMAAHMILSCVARMRSATPAGLVLEITHPPKSDVTLFGCAAAVRFPFKRGVAGFVERITEVRELDHGGLEVTIGVPERLQLDDRRAAVRIPVPPDTLRAAIINTAGRQAVIPIDISMTGVLIEVDTSRRGAIELGQTLELQLALPGEALGGGVLLVEAEVCRRDGDRYGLRYAAGDEERRGLTALLYLLQDLGRSSR